ncbi:murein biosynthesis integral membrane protein MurJ [Oceanidesulfovibrio marinus]|uniref:Probable lipid II flippase MurJ n=1 Tax=Oceanidesulfovibrio marinus TaxID=370038 RepID=A0ABX6NIF8_9BACT|nr:murein biosynthesis integral membrane protein MurJ [Oceanidesulfovibrio marinus]QJT10427.1 murein biosynthesis integral membrane protein MurJ [Oceanidesulfovibrio marinus]
MDEGIQQTETTAAGAGGAVKQDGAEAIAVRASSVAAATMASRLLGFVRDIIIASVLGVGPLADAFFAAFRFPLVVRRFFSEGALSLSVMPALAERQARDGWDGAQHLARSFLLRIGLWFVPAVVVILIAARPLAELVAPGFEAAQLDRMAALMRLMMPYLVCIAAVALLAAVCNFRDRFFLPAAIPAVFNLCIITGGVLAVLAGWDTALVIAACVSIAGVAQLVILAPAVRRLGFSVLGPADLRDPQAKAMLRRLGPVLVGSSSFQAMIVAATILATAMTSGSVGAIYFADRLIHFPLGIVGVAVATATLPRLSAHHAEKRHSDFRQVWEDGVALSLFLTLPAMAGLLALSGPITSLLFEHGAFDAHAAGMTAGTLRGFVIGLPALAASRALVAVLFAAAMIRQAVVASVAGMLCFAVLAWPAMAWQGAAGLAGAGALASWFVFLVQARAVSRTSGEQAHAPVWRAIVRRAFVPAVLSVGVFLAAWAMCGVLPPSWRRWSVIAIIPLCGAGYMAASLRLGVAESRALMQSLRKGGRRA